MKDEDYMKAIRLYGYTNDKTKITGVKYVIPVYISEISIAKYLFYECNKSHDEYTCNCNGGEYATDKKFRKVKLITEPDKDYYIADEDF